MKNNFPTAAYSETAHELLDDPAEAWFTYRAGASNQPGRGLSARTRPMLIGRVKSARRFSLALCDPASYIGSGLKASADRMDEPAPLELALNGVASCALMTLISGGSTQGVTYDSAKLSIQYGGSEASNLRCRFEVRSDLEERLMRELLELVQQLSPNYRTLTDEIPLNVILTDKSGATIDRRVVQGGTAVKARRTAGCRVQWVSGTQFISYPEGTAVGSALRVDAPKQLAGVDWGPNAQEYFLMALAADIAARLSDVSARVLDLPMVWEVITDAQVDVRGFLRVDPGSLVPMQNINCTVVLPDVSTAELSLIETVFSAVAESEVADLICQPHPVEVELEAVQVG